MHNITEAWKRDNVSKSNHAMVRHTSPYSKGYEFQSSDSRLCPWDEEEEEKDIGPSLFYFNNTLLHVVIIFEM